MKNKNYKYWIHGITGRVGQTLEKLLEFKGLIGGSSKNFKTKCKLNSKPLDIIKLSEILKDIDIIIDFSSPEANEILLKSLQNLKSKYILIATTNIKKDILDSWHDLVKNDMRLLFAPNTSLGIRSLLKSAIAISQNLSNNGFDIKIIETHHKHKKDAPSGTAKMLGNALSKQLKLPVSSKNEYNLNEIGIQAIRGGSVFGEHTIRFMGPHEEISLTHRAYDLNLFAQGALDLSDWLIKQDAGVYSIEDIKN